MHVPPAGDIAFVVAGALTAGFVNGLSGTGYSLVALGFWLHAMSPITSVPLAALCSLGGHVQSLPRIWRGVIWSRLWPFLATGVIGVPVGTTLLRHIQVQPLKLGVGLLLVFYCSWMAFVRRPPIVTGGGRLADAAIGIVGGVMGGMASLSGPAPTIWSQLRGWDMHEQRGVNQPFNMSILILALVSSAVAGFLDRTFLIWAVLAFPSTLIGARVGLLLYKRINDRQFRRIILSLLTASGITLIISALA
jgi:uncharacterized membrane protein YfcA